MVGFTMPFHREGNQTCIITKVEKANMQLYESHVARLWNPKGLKVPIYKSPVVKVWDSKLSGQNVGIY